MSLPLAQTKDTVLAPAADGTVLPSHDFRVSVEPAVPPASQPMVAQPHTPSAAPSRAPSPAPSPRRHIDSRQPSPPDDSPLQDRSSRSVLSRQEQRALDVGDALSYLDAVKSQFQDEPDVYNQFLDIMKEFKTESLDTPGVIKRVSELFQGHPYLIQGFNTFLPTGYHIDTSADPNTITVTTPTGTTTQTTQSTGALGLLTESTSSPPLPQAPLPPPIGPAAPVSPSLHASRAATVLGGMHRHPSDPKPQPSTEFNHAIQYINRIKTRFSNDPDTYKEFLEVLQTYQKQQKTAQEVKQVYAHVLNLFKDAPELLAEFNQFLPDIAGDARDALISSVSDKSARRKPAPQLPLPSAPPKRKKRVEKELPPPKKPKHHHDASPPPMHHNGYATQGLPSAAIAAQQHAAGHAISSPEELAFFERAKRHIDDRMAYDEFLKLLNLFAKDIIDARTLVAQARTYLGEGDLLAQFKGVLGCSDPEPLGSAARKSQPLTVLDRVPQVEMRYGPSYRRLPASEVALACSGRDALCRAVLNDEWVSHPTWMSEDSVFQAHKKNAYEEALHKSEEERHEYDFHIEALARTIALLEPLYQRVLRMDADTRAAFRLPPGLGAASPPIAIRVLKKVYGREAGLEVAQALCDAPGVALPVVLARLKQKDDEWRRAQREWNRIWREVDARNFYKSLDHQGITFKALDKKQLTAKSLVAQLEGVPRRAPRGRPHELGADFKDESVLQDTMKLVFSFLDRAPGPAGAPFGAREARRIERHLRELVPLMLLADPASFDAAFGAAPDGEDIAGPPADDTGSSTPRARALRTDDADLPAPDLRRRLLTVQTQKRVGAGGAEDDDAPTAVPAPAAPPPPAPRRGKRKARKRAPNEDVWLAHRPDQYLPDFHAAAQGKGKPVVAPSKRITPAARLPFFANTTYYALWRLISLLYSRLLMCKELAAGMAADRTTSHAANTIAVELGLHDSASGLVGALSDTVASKAPTPPAADAMVVDGSPPQGNAAAQFYTHFLDSCEKLFEGEMEPLVFEENMRFMFGTQAYLVFTVDKVVGAIVKQLQLALMDPKCVELLLMLRREREREREIKRTYEEGTPKRIANSLVRERDLQDQIRYRREAEAVLGTDEHLFKICWAPATKTMTFQLVARTDKSFYYDDGDDALERWIQYTASFVMEHPTEDDALRYSVAESAGPVSGADSGDGAGISDGDLPAAGEADKDGEGDDDGWSGKLRRPFLRRNMSQAEDGAVRRRDGGGLEVRFCLRTYRMFFVAGQGDCAWAVRTAEALAAGRMRVERRGMADVAILSVAP